MAEIVVESQLDVLKRVRNEMQDKLVRNQIDFEFFNSKRLIVNNGQERIQIEREFNIRKQAVADLTTILRIIDELIKKIPTVN